MVGADVPLTSLPLLLLPVSVPLPLDGDPGEAGDEEGDPLPVDKELAGVEPGNEELGKFVVDGSPVPVPLVKLEETPLEIVPETVPETVPEIVTPDETIGPDCDAEGVGVSVSEPVPWLIGVDDAGKVALKVDVKVDVNVEAVPDPVAGGPDVPVPGVGCELVNDNDSLGVEAEAEGNVPVPLGDVPLDIIAEVIEFDTDDVAVPPELVPDTPFDPLPVIEEPMFVAVVFPGTPDVKLDIATVEAEVEFENVIEAGVDAEAPVFVTLPPSELWDTDTVVVIGTPFESVLVTVVNPIVEAPPLPCIELCVRDIVVVIGNPLESVPVTVVKPPELEDAVVPAEPELLVVVLGLPLLVCVVPVKFDEPVTPLPEGTVDIDAPGPVALPEGNDALSVMTVVVAFEAEVGDVVIVFEPLIGEDGVDVCVVEFDEPDKLVAVWLPPPLAEEPVAVVVGRVVIPEPLRVTELDGKLALEFCPEESVDVVPAPPVGTVMLPETVVMRTLLGVDPEEAFAGTDIDEPDEIEDAVELLLNGGSVMAG
ncbi:hypothetical protein F4808DRAFT_458034 [Astrocystis sublimbata]|nr:hypothetical protein F4808DRAFT_458034 [Astrocystis sublimbata]